MLEQLRTQIAARLAERSQQVQAMEEVLAAPTAEARNLDDEEAPRFAELRDSIQTIDQAVDDMQSRVAELEELDRRTAEREELARTLQPEASTAEVSAVKVTRDEPTYRRGGNHSFFKDYYSVKYQMGDIRGASERLSRHDSEVRLGEHGQEFRDVGTSAFGALVVPQYLPEMYAEVLRAGRITANLCTPHDLPPEGMTMTIPRGTTGTVAHAQTGENASVTEVDFDDTDLVVSVRTYAGQQDVSRQAIERGRGVDEIIYMDLAGSYASNLDGDVINGPGTGGRHGGIYGTTGVLTVSSTVSNSVTNVLSKVAEAISVVNSNRFMPADVIVMHPRRWGWLVSPKGDSSSRPYVLPRENMPQNSFGVGEPAAYGLVGSLYGIPVFTDANIPTTVTTGSTGDAQDIIIVAKRSDLHLWEESVAPRQFRFEETLGGQLTVKLVIAGYSAFTAGHHPEGAVVVVGSSLNTPVF
jgi:HK97 family phage major capsid protein